MFGAVPSRSPKIELAEIAIDCRDTSLVGTFWSSLLGATLRVPAPVLVMADPEGNEFCLVQHRPRPAR